MTLSTTYRAMASTCGRQALEESDRVECERLLRMAGYWIVLAQNEEWIVNNSLATGLAGQSTSTATT